MKIKNFKFLMLLTLCFCLFSVSCFAQEKNETEEEKVYKRAESFLQTIRDGKWDEIYKFVVVVTGKKDKYTKIRMEISEEDDEKEIQKKVGDFFQQIYGSLEPEEIITPVRFNPKDDTLASITYMHGDKDGFHMRKVDGEWYYTLDYR